MTDPDTIRARGLSEDDAEVFADTLTENEDDIRHCSGECSDCPNIQTCMN